MIFSSKQVQLETGARKCMPIAQDTLSCWIERCFVKLRFGSRKISSVPEFKVVSLAVTFTWMVQQSIRFELRKENVIGDSWAVISSWKVSNCRKKNNQTSTKHRTKQIKIYPKTKQSSLKAVSFHYVCVFFLSSLRHRFNWIFFSSFYFIFRLVWLFN